MVKAKQSRSRGFRTASNIADTCLPCSDSHAALMVGDARFHKECLRCCVCRCGLDGKMVTLDKENRPYCSKDYDK